MNSIHAELTNRVDLALELAALTTRDFDEGYHIGFAHGLREARDLIEQEGIE